MIKRLSTTDIFLTPILKGNIASLKDELPRAQWEYYENQHRPGKDFWVLRKKLIIEWTGDFPGVKRITLQPGWVTDFGSVPLWVPRSVVSHSDPRFLEAYIVHDAAYALQGWISRLGADQLLDDIAEHRDAPAWKRWVVKSALRVGGQGPWDDSTLSSEYESEWNRFSWEDK